MTSICREDIVDRVPETCARCGASQLSERGRRHAREHLEEVVYVKQRIKHFDREGSEYWTEMEIPDLVETDVEVDELELACGACGNLQRVRVRTAA